MPLTAPLPLSLPAYARLDLATPLRVSRPAIVTQSADALSPDLGTIIVLTEASFTLVTTADLGARTVVLSFRDQDNAIVTSSAAAGSTQPSSSEAYIFSTSVTSAFVSGSYHMSPMPLIAVLPGYKVLLSVVTLAADQMSLISYHGTSIPTGPDDSVSAYAPHVPSPLVT